MSVPVGEMPTNRMIGKPEGRIPEFLPKPWDPMTIVGHTEHIVHAVPSNNRALCGYRSATGWQWARGFDVTCEHCCRKILEDEFESDGIVQHLRSLGHTGPIDRDTYIGFNWAGCDLSDWGAEWEAELPTLLQCWDTNEWPWNVKKEESDEEESEE
jgi:hypothetical protein